jgi:hypothetical protein
MNGAGGKGEAMREDVATRWIIENPPNHRMGYREGRLRELLSDRWNVFAQWFGFQTVGLERTDSGSTIAIYYRDDVRRFLTRLLVVD